MVFIETLGFTRLIQDYLNDDDYNEFQNFLMEHPNTGDIISGTGGIRKVRWRLRGKGKRGGVRIIYYWHSSHDFIYLLTIYAKNEMTDLSISERKELKQIMERLLP